MTRVGVKALKDQLSSYLRLARQGERIVVTEHGKPVAILSPFEESEDVSRAWDLVRSGAASWSGGKPQGSTNPPKPIGKSVSEMVIEDRR